MDHSGGEEGCFSVLANEACLCSPLLRSETAPYTCPVLPLAFFLIVLSVNRSIKSSPVLFFAPLHHGSFLFVSPDDRSSSLSVVRRIRFMMATRRPRRLLFPLLDSRFTDALLFSEQPSTEWSAIHPSSPWSIARPRLHCDFFSCFRIPFLLAVTRIPTIYMSPLPRSHFFSRVSSSPTVDLM